MKKRKIIRRVVRDLALVLAVCVLAAALSGCRKLDEMRASHAYYKGETEKNVEVLYFRGDEYKKLPALRGEDELLINSESGSFYLTAEDVPVLLSDRFGHTIYVDKNLDIIESKGSYFARAEVYDKYSGLMRDYVLDRYYTQFNYYDYAQYGVSGYDGETRRYLFVEQGKNILDAAFAAGGVMEESETLRAKETEINRKYDTLFPIYRCDAEPNILRYRGQVCRGADGRFFIEDYSQEHEQYVYYAIPDEGQAFFHELFGDLETGWVAWINSFDEDTVIRKV